MGKTIRTLSGMKFNLSTHEYEPWHREYELENPQRAELKQMEGMSKAEKRELARIGEEIKERQEWYKDTFYYWYVQLEDDGVPFVKRRAARLALIFFTHLFGTPWPVSIKWFRIHTADERRDLRERGLEGGFEEFKSNLPLNGCVRGEHVSEIWIDVNPGLASIIGTVAHELIHVPQSVSKMSKEEMEVEAEQKAQWGVYIFYKKRRDLWESLQQ